MLILVLLLVGMQSMRSLHHGFCIMGSGCVSIPLRVPNLEPSISITLNESGILHLFWGFPSLCDLYT